MFDSIRSVRPGWCNGQMSELLAAWMVQAEAVPDYDSPQENVSNLNQDPPTGCLETLTGGFWAPVVTRKHLLEGAGREFFTVEADSHRVPELKSDDLHPKSDSN